MTDHALHHQVEPSREYDLDLTVTAGVMPRWGHRLDPVTIRMLAAYVHSLGGGEATPRPVQAAAAAAP